LLCFYHATLLSLEVLCCPVSYPHNGGSRKMHLFVASLICITASL
jgi:hypothetical protein